MKISDKELQKIIHEELQEAVRKGEMTEQELKQIEEASIKNWFKDVGKAIGTAGSVGMRKYRKERAKTAEKEKAAKAAGGVDPNRLTPELTRQILDKPGTNPPAVQSGPPAASSAPVAVQQVQKPIDTFLQAFDRLSREAVTADLNVDGIVGNVIAKNVNGKLVMLPASDPKAKAAFDAALKAAQARLAQAKPWHAGQDLGNPENTSQAQPPQNPSATTTSANPQKELIRLKADLAAAVRDGAPKEEINTLKQQIDKAEGAALRSGVGLNTESKNPSYQETYNKWQKLIKG